MLPAIMREQRLQFPYFINISYYIDHLSGPGRAICPVCRCVCVPTTAAPPLWKAEAADNMAAAK